MKHFLSFLLCICFILNSKAQTFFQLNTEYLKSKNEAYGFYASLGKQFYKQKLQISNGIGLQFFKYSKPNIPIYLQTLYKFTEKTHSPFIEGRIGLSFWTDNRVDDLAGSWEDVDYDYKPQSSFYLSLKSGLIIKSGKIDLGMYLGLSYFKTNLNFSYVQEGMIVKTINKSIFGLGFIINRRTK